MGNYRFLPDLPSSQFHDQSSLCLWSRVGLQYLDSKPVMLTRSLFEDLQIEKPLRSVFKACPECIDADVRSGTAHIEPLHHFPFDRPIEGGGVAPVEDDVASRTESVQILVLDHHGNRVFKGFSSVDPDPDLQFIPQRF